MQIPSYSKPKNYGKKAIDLENLHKNEVVVQEKIDGSQISWYVDDEDVLHIRSKGSLLVEGNVPDQFTKAYNHLQDVKDDIPRGVYFRGEAHKAPRHNHLTYTRGAKNGIVLFDAEEVNPERFGGQFWGHRSLTWFARQMDIDVTQQFMILEPGEVFTAEKFAECYAKESVLGGKIEGVVLKNYFQFGPDGKVLMGKWVSDEFREVEGKKGDRRKALDTPVNVEFIEFCKRYQTEARWRKGIQHLADAGTLTNSPKDIGPLIAEIHRDIEEEEKDSIIEGLSELFPTSAHEPEALYQAHRKQLMGFATNGFAQFYKKYLNE